MQNQYVFQVMFNKRWFWVENQRRTEKEIDEMEKQMHQVEKRQVEAEMRINEAIEDHSLAEEICVDVEEMERKAVTDPMTFQ